MQEVNRRNTESFAQALKEVINKMFDQQKQIDNLNNTISTLYERMNSLEKQILMQKVKLTGLGPSVKE